MVALADRWVVGFTPGQHGAACELVKTLHLAVNNQAPNRLLVTDTGLALQVGAFLPQYADFSWDTWKKRRDAGKKQGIVRACRPAAGVRILDATAGWGRDAAILAAFGAEVVMLEREPVMAALLRDALVRQDPLSGINLALSLLETDAMQYLACLEDTAFDVIYLDPMHPVRKKTARVKKDLQALQQFIPPDEDVLSLLQLARTKARVVVKWPSNHPPLAPASFSIPGKTIRYDVFK